MAHMRTQIREAVATALTGLSTTGANVYQSRVYAIDSNDLPALRIYTESETSETHSVTGPRPLLRTLQIIVEGVARATADVDDVIDQIAAEVEAAIGGSNLSGLVYDLILTGTELTLSREAEQPTGMVRMTWMTQYRTLENDAETSAI